MKRNMTRAKLKPINTLTAPQYIHTKHGNHFAYHNGCLFEYSDMAKRFTLYKKIPSTEFRQYVDSLMVQRYGTPSKTRSASI